MIPHRALWGIVGICRHKRSRSYRQLIGHWPNHPPKRHYDPLRIHYECFGWRVIRCRNRARAFSWLRAYGDDRLSFKEEHTLCNNDGPCNLDYSTGLCFAHYRNLL